MKKIIIKIQFITYDATFPCCWLLHHQAGCCAPFNKVVDFVVCRMEYIMKAQIHFFWLSLIRGNSDYFFFLWERLSVEPVFSFMHSAQWR